MKHTLMLLATFFFFIENAVAYVGPGLGLGGIGAVVGIIVAVFLAIVGLVWYPLKRLLKGKASDSAADKESDET